MENICKLKKKLWKNKKNILHNSAKDIILYTSYRISELLKKIPFISFLELRYNLCEVGYGRNRLDPLSLEIILNSESFKKLLPLKQIIKEKNVIFFIKSGTDLMSYDKLINVKTGVINEIEQAKKTKNLYENLRKLIVSICEENNCAISNYNDNLENDFIELEIANNNGQRFLLRYHNREDWLYPYSDIIWKLYERAYEKECIPLIIYPYIHVSCFPVFKNIGIYARTTYFTFLDDEVIDITKPILKLNDEGLTQFIDFGKYDNLNSRLKNWNLNNLLNMISKEVYDSSLIKLKKEYKIVKPMFKIKSNDITEKIKSIEAVFKTLKMGRNKNFKKSIQTYKRLNS